MSAGGRRTRLLRDPRVLWVAVVATAGALAWMHRPVDYGVIAALWIIGLGLLVTSERRRVRRSVLEPPFRHRRS